MQLARWRQAREWRVLAWCLCCGGVCGWLVISMSNMIDTLQCNIVIAWLLLRVCIASGNIITPSHALLCHEIIKQQLFIILNSLLFAQHNANLQARRIAGRIICSVAVTTQLVDLLLAMREIYEKRNKSWWRNTENDPDQFLIIVGVSCHKDLGGVRLMITNHYLYYLNSI